jgi:hypothetical protein
MILDQETKERIKASYQEIGENLSDSQVEHLFACMTDPEVEIDPESLKLINKLSPWENAGPIRTFP